MVKVTITYKNKFTYTYEVNSDRAMMSSLLNIMNDSFIKSIRFDKKEVKNG